MTHRIARSAALALLGATPLAAIAQPAFPLRPLRLVVAFPAGGAADFLGRITA